MAIIQLSKIQVRRGQKGVTGVPQLSSGEFGWAIDAQELYIGNGNINEGAPYLGNTRILTEYDKQELVDLIEDSTSQSGSFDLSGLYVFKKGTPIQTGVLPEDDTERSIQDRLDDRVSIRSFGAKGDGTDQTIVIQRAIDELYLRNDYQTNVILHFEPGRYEVSDTIYIPPNVTLTGAGQGKSTFVQTADSDLFRTVNGSSAIGSPADDSTTDASNQPNNITIRGFTLEVHSARTAIHLQDVINSSFEDLEIVGDFEYSVDSAQKQNAAIRTEVQEGLESKNIKFKNCSIKDFSYGVISNSHIQHFLFSDISLEYLSYGFVFGEDLAVIDPPTSINITLSIFNEIENQAILIPNGNTITSISNRFYKIGCSGGNEDAPVYPVIQCDNGYFLSDNDYFSRTSTMIFDDLSNTNEYITEIQGTGSHKLSQSLFTSLPYSNNPSGFLKLPLIDNQSLQIEYALKGVNFTGNRTGIITITPNGQNDQPKITDMYDYSGESVDIEDFQFTSSFDQSNNLLLHVNNDNTQLEAEILFNCSFTQI